MVQEKLHFVTYGLIILFQKITKQQLCLNFPLKGNYYKVQIWDLAGQDKNIYTSKVFTKGSHGCLILYDTQDKKSFENTIKWKKAIDDNARFIDETPLPIVLVQNKIDLVEPEALKGDEEELKKFVDEELVVKLGKILMKQWIIFWQILLID